jgi:hypothetical protein
MKAARHVAQCNTGQDVPCTTYARGIRRPRRPKGGGGDYGSTTGGYDQIGLGTLVYAT